MTLLLAQTLLTQLGLGLAVQVNQMPILIPVSMKPARQLQFGGYKHQFVPVEENLGYLSVDLDCF